MQKWFNIIFNYIFLIKTILPTNLDCMYTNVFVLILSFIFLPPLSWSEERVGLAASSSRLCSHVYPFFTATRTPVSARGWVWEQWKEECGGRYKRKNRWVRLWILDSGRQAEGCPWCIVVLITMLRLLAVRQWQAESHCHSLQLPIHGYPLWERGILSCSLSIWGVCRLKYLLWVLRPVLSTKSR